MGSEKIYMFGEPGGNSLASVLPSLIQNKGLDPNLAAALMNGNNNRDAYGGGQWWIWIILLFFCRGGFGGGFGGGEGIPAALHGDAGRELLMNAIQGNRTAIESLATNLNCSIQNIQNSLFSTQREIDRVGDAVSACCCQTQNSITQLGCQVSAEFCNQTNVLTSQATANTQRLVDNMNTGNQNIISEIRDFRNELQQNRYNDLLAQNTRLQTVLDLRDQQNAMARTVETFVAPVSAQVAAANHRLEKIEEHQLPTYHQAYIPGYPVVPTYAAGVAGYSGASGYSDGCGCGY